MNISKETEVGTVPAAVSVVVDLSYLKAEHTQLIQHHKNEILISIILITIISCQFTANNALEV
jgi:hypothetical protein